MAFLLGGEHHRTRGTVVMVVAMIAVVLAVVLLLGATASICGASLDQTTGG